MKAKHVFMSLVLPSVLAACTADDFVTEQGNLNLSNRPVVGNVEFVLPGAETRVDVENGKYKWTENDKLGAALMDTWNSGSDYTISDNLFTNYRYDYVNGSFTNSNAVFVEGNYFVYAPFNANQKREGLAYSINNVQEAGEDGTQALTDNQFFLDHIFVAQGNASVEVNPIAVFPRIILNAQYEGSEDVQINKIVITDLTGKFGVNGKVKPASTSVSYNVLDNVNPTGIPSAGFNAGNYKITTTGDLAQAYTKYKLAINDLNVKYTLAEGESEKDFVNPNIAAFYAADAETKAETMTLKYTVPSDDVKAIMVAPIAEAHAESNVTIELYTNRGLVTIAGNASTMSNNFGLDTDVATYPTNLGDGLLDKAQMAVAFTGVKDYISGVKAGKSQNVTIKFKDDAILVPPTLTVTSTEELKYYLNNWYAGKKSLIAPNAGNEVVVTAAPAEGEAIELDGEVLSFIKNTAANPTIKFVGDIVIPEGADATTINYIEKGSADLNVINKATQNWTVAGEFTTLTNEGTLTIGTGAVDETATYTVTTINNNNSLTVNKAIGTGLTDYVNNLGTLVANANINANVINGTVDVDGNHTAKMTLNTGSVTILTNYAEFEVPAGKNVTVQKIENYYNAVISGTLRTATVSKSLNAAGATITLNEGAKWNVADSQSGFENNGTVTNKGTITVDEKFTNKGTVNNYKQIACSDGASFNNEKLMNVYANSITLISKNDDPDAEIIVEQGVTTINVAGEDKGKITFVVSSQKGLESIPTIANSLRITAAEIDLSELNNAKITFVEFKPAGNMSITCKSDDNVNSFNVVTFTADSAEKQFNLSGNLTAAEKLTIGTNATVVINDKLTFASARGEDFVNNGSMLIIGTLNFSAIAVADKGTVELGNYLFAGGSASTNITWKPAAGDGAGTIG